MQQRPSHSHQNSIDDNPWLAGFFIAVFVFLGFFVLSLRYHISTLQWVEGGVYIILLLASIWLLFAWRSLDRNRDREPFQMPFRSGRAGSRESGRPGRSPAWLHARQSARDLDGPDARHAGAAVRHEWFRQDHHA